MIVVDTSAFISISIADILKPVLDEYDVHTTQHVVDELRTTADYDDVHGTAADHVLAKTQHISVHEVNDPEVQTSRIDEGEATCIQVAQRRKADFLITDDLRALPELQQLTDAQVAISPILLRALVKRNVLTNHEAKDRLEEVAASRDWLGAPIYRRAQQLFEQ
jgi:predicted nucleic acid-binding protein